jgi:hypothetical protein
MNIKPPDSKLAREITDFVQSIEKSLLFNHSCRVYQFAAMTGEKRGLRFDAELLYAGAMFHDLGLTSKFSSADKRFEVDGANAAREFLAARKIDTADIDVVWTAIALHTTPGIPEFMHPVVALLTAGVEMDVLGVGYDKFSDEERNTIVQAFPRTPQFKEDILNAFYEGIKSKPQTTFGNVKADVIADKEPDFRPGNFCSVIRGSKWSS